MENPEYKTTQARPPKILIVDDQVENLIALEKSLLDLDVVFIRALSGSDALASILEHEFALILLDVQMPDMDGFETAELIRGDEASKHIPIIFVTATSKDQKLVFKGYHAGAVDYMLKPLDLKILKTKVSVFVDLYKQKAIIAQTNEYLKAANRKILEQQEALIEEERLKVLLQMAGASAHELNQPLMSLLGNIELIRMIENDPAQVKQRLDNIETASRRIADIVKKMQNIRRDDVKAYPGGTGIVDLNQDIHLLAVEDCDNDFELLQTLVKHQKQIRLTRARNISEGLRMAQKAGVDVIILDYLLPDGNGLDFLSRMESLGMEKPVLAMTGHGDEVVASRMVKAGAYDYLPKAGANQDLIIRSIKTALEKSRLRKEVAQATQMLAQMATHDGLTGLHNRRQMNDILSCEFNRAARFGTDLACLMLDLDYFKEVNDTFGHDFGDFVLQQFATRLTDNVRESDTCFRYGGEEFMILLPHTDIQGAGHVGEKIRRLCENKPYTHNDYEKIVTASIGVSSLRHHAPTRPEDLVICADRALYRAKAEGRNRVKIYLAAFPSGAGMAGADAIDFKSLKDRLAALLDKTRTASVEVLEHFVHDTGSNQFKDHNQRVVKYLGLVGAKLGLPSAIIRTLQRAASLHDCTKVLLSQTLMEKNKHLDEAEMDKIKDHPLLLAELVEPFDFFADERAVLLYHHENFNGSGYPDGLQGDQIPIGARIFSIVDALVAMTSARPYRDKLAAEQVLRELVDNAGTQFDPNLVEHFLDVIAENDLIDIPAQNISAAKAKVAGIKS